MAVNHCQSESLSNDDNVNSSTESVPTMVKWMYYAFVASVKPMSNHHQCQVMSYQCRIPINANDCQISLINVQSAPDQLQRQPPTWFTNGLKWADDRACRMCFLQSSIFYVLPSSASAIEGVNFVACNQPYPFSSLVSYWIYVKIASLMLVLWQSMQHVWSVLLSSEHLLPHSRDPEESPLMILRLLSTDGGLTFSWLLPWRLPWQQPWPFPWPWRRTNCLQAADRSQSEFWLAFSRLQSSWMVFWQLHQSQDRLVFSELQAKHPPYPHSQR